jgi:hypothetical protein
MITKLLVAANNNEALLIKSLFELGPEWKCVSIDSALIGHRFNLIVVMPCDHEYYSESQTRYVNERYRFLETKLRLQGKLVHLQSIGRL